MRERLTLWAAPRSDESPHEFLLQSPGCLNRVARLSGKNEVLVGEFLNTQALGVCVRAIDLVPV